MSFLSVIRQLTMEPLILSMDCVFALVLHKTTMVKAALLAVALISGIPLFAFTHAASRAEQKGKKLPAVLIPLLLILLLLAAARMFFDGLQPLKGSKFPLLPDLSAPAGTVAAGTAAVSAMGIWLLVSVRKPLRVSISICAAVIYGAVLFSAPSGMSLYWLAAHGTALVLMLLFRKTGKPAKEEKPVTRTERNSFYAGCALLALLTGLYLPGKVILSSPLDFINIRNYQSPLIYLVSSFALSTGFFLLWIPVFYTLSEPKTRRIFSCAAVCLAVVAAVNGFFFGNQYGTMSSLLQYEQKLANPLTDSLINAALCIAVAAAVFFVWKKDSFITQALTMSLCLAVLAMSVINLFTTQATVDDSMKSMDMDRLTNQAELPLAKNRKNVVIIMLDRAASGFFPYIIEEKPELREQFAGFTYYPNTVSYSHFTGWGAPPLYGGYEYTPENINKRSDVLLVDKHNEALSVMPVVFLNAGFDVTVCDPSYAGYSSIPDLSIYDAYPGIKAYITQGNMELSVEGVAEQEEKIRQRNFFCYGVMRSAPVCLHSVLYSGGQYNDSNGDFFNVGNQNVTGISTARGLNPDFLNDLEVLKQLPTMTVISGGENGSFIMMANETSHDAALTQTPDYSPEFVIDNTEYDREHMVRRDAEGNELILTDTKSMTHYHANMASLIQLGRWFDSLREQGVYDNTRIIIVADHGVDLAEFGLKFGDCHLGWGNAGDIMAYNPLLLVKDFNSTELTTDSQFMTNADTPSIAFNGLIDKPVNPFTGNPIDDHEKNESTEQHIAATRYFNVEQQRTKTIYQNITWIRMKNDVFKVEDWQFMDGP